MKKFIYFSSIVALMAGSATLCGCSDFLEAENKSAGGITADTYFSSDPNALLVSAFASLKTFADQDDQYGIYDQGTDLYVNTRGMALSSFMQYTMTPDDAVVQKFYSNCYGTINFANGVLNYADPTSEEAYQARFLRGYGYFLLTQHFGGVPYVTKYVNDANRAYPRMDLAEEYASIIDDLKDLYDNSTLAATDHTSGKASKQAVAALIAKLYLAAGWDVDTELKDAVAGTYSVKGTANFSQAFAWAEKAIAGQALTMSFEDKWLCKNEGNVETIWSIKYQSDGYSGALASGGNKQSGTYGGYYGSLKGCNSRNAQSVKSLYLFEKGDERYEGTFMTSFYHGDNLATGYMSYYTKSAADLASSSIDLKFFPSYMTESEAKSWLTAHKSQMLSTSKAALMTSPNVVAFTFNADGSVKSQTSKSLSDYYAGTENGACVKKFDDPVTVNYCYRDIVCLHVSEIYLTAAEAALMAGDKTNFWKYINAVRTRAGLTKELTRIEDYTKLYTTTSSFGAITELDLLLDERARETYAEKSRFVDLRRTKQLVRYNLEFCKDYIPSVEQMKGVDGEIKWLRPIPSGEIENNTAMTKADQNPGYVEL